MGDVVNLNQFRKKAERAEKEQRAATNRARTGCTKAERQSNQIKTERRDSGHKGKKLDRDHHADRPDDDPEPA
ncbi:MAG: DUF4169 family protein [Alphaproteobacteria bacterium]|nr:DUF4169 family protein [Alphaproteobacteria bacterium]